MAYVIAEPCIGTKDTARVDACPGRRGFECKRLWVLKKSRQLAG